LWTHPLGRLVRVPLERVISPTSVIVPTQEQTIRVRREQELVLEYGRYLKELGLTVSRLRLPLEETTLVNDVYVEERGQLIEAKGSTSREAIRMAIGQLLDYSFIAEQDGLERFRLAVLLPDRPSQSIEALLQSQEISVVWAGVQGFEDNVDGAFT
jgi:hypothetical protein